MKKFTFDKELFHTSGIIFIGAIFLSITPVFICIGAIELYTFIKGL